jgi:type IV secretion system protein VirB10
VTEKIDKEALALKEARLKSAIVIYNKSSTEKGGESNQSSVPTDPNRRFQEEARSSEVPTSQAKTLGNLDLKILQGKIVDAIMETAVNSDLPGMVRAVVSHDLYGESGRTILLPRGTRLVGQYNSSIRKGQARVFFIWNRAIRPDGIEIVLDSGGTDPLGRAGINGKVNNHFWQIFGTSALLSLIGSGAANAGVNTNDQLNSISAYREELANSFRDTSAQVLDRYIDIPPTINVKQGTRIKVLVARDLDFSETLGSQALSSANQGSWVFRL